MSGGFFRGTSADQDTRFSNKQAKLLKSQKFPHELENLVDMTKVKIDVMKPWIAKRVTELIGFEDEVLINFIYGLLEGEAVNGKQIQISLTGFMERNTAKFMKELWLLLLSAQQNVSGVPQQFLDAKEEEAKIKKAETDRIANEIQRKKEKEKQEFYEEKAKMDGDGANSRDNHSELEPNVKHYPRGSAVQQENEKERHNRNGRRRSSRSCTSPVIVFLLVVIVAYVLYSCKLICNLAAVSSGGQEAFLGDRHQEVAPFPPKDELALHLDGLLHLAGAMLFGDLALQGVGHT
ncbi:hypothetical protein SASPL_127939 [Salvia splendens]|uniref:PWI domain-containing protein n=1 Tax=Salvia splendens TaxID=180675 RepID=A0A8X8XBI7_SALSN|nr:hypothetical protein SASPL_127939 [Salvia splendens]